MGAINTVALREGKLHGFNTDGPGLAAAILEEFGVPLGNLRVLVLGGAGGAGRAITILSVLEGSPSVMIANRSPEKGAALASEIRHGLGKTIANVSMDPAELSKAVSSSDLIINATPLGMKAGDPSPLTDGLLDQHHLVYDTVYSGGSTALLKQGSRAGAKSANGFSMLLHQGALAFELWFAKTAPLETMRAALKSVTR